MGKKKNHEGIRPTQSVGVELAQRANSSSMGWWLVAMSELWGSAEKKIKGFILIAAE